MPVVIGSGGVEKVVELTLNEKETKNLNISIKDVKELYKAACKIDQDLNN